MEVESSEEILINMKTSYPRITDYSAARLSWRVGPKLSSIFSPLIFYQQRSFPSFFWSYGSTNEHELCPMKLIQSFGECHYALFTHEFSWLAMQTIQCKAIGNKLINWMYISWMCCQRMSRPLSSARNKSSYYMLNGKKWRVFCTM